MPLMRKRVLWILLVVAALTAAITVAVLLRKLAPPEPARLLPPADAFIYLNLKTLRRAGVFEQMPPVKLDPEYEQFVEATGFQFERDLDEVALAVHLPRKANAGGTAPQETRYSEVFAARFDSSRLAAYLKRISSGVERYGNLEIYLVPLPGRTVRATVLGPGLVAASNTDGPAAIQGMIDRARELALPFGGPPLLRQHYRDVPFLSLAWGVARISPPDSGAANRLFVLPGGLDLFLPSGTVLLASLRYTGALQLQLQAFSVSEADANRLSDQLNAFLAVLQALEAGSQPTATAPDVKSLLDTVRIDHSRNRVDLTASVPTDLLQKLVTEPPPPPSPPPPAPAPKTAPRRRHRK